MVITPCVMKARIRTLLLILLPITPLIHVARADMAAQINAVIRKPAHKNLRFAVHVVKADSGKTVYAHNASRPMIPASNMKIIVTATALKLLGADYHYTTKVGMCDDKLVIIGSGDPLLGDEATDGKYGRKSGWLFHDIAEKLKASGIATINDIIIDSTVFDDNRVHPSWPANQLNQWYACEVSGLNYNDNCIDITVRNIGGRVKVLTEPKTNFVKIVNKVKPIKNGSGAIGALRNNQPNVFTVTGKCKKQQGPVPVAIERPPAFFGYLLAEKLIGAGLNTTGRLVEKGVPDQCDFRLIAEYRTPMADCLARSNKNSLGLVAEALLKTIAAKSEPGGKNGSWEGGRRVVSKFLTGLGIDKSEFYIDDGSGLSRQNRLTAGALTKVLLHVYKSPEWPVYRDSLAVGGVDGTIGKYFREPEYKGKIRGKTGYIRGVKSFSGVCSSEKGDYIFAILVNINEKKPYASIKRSEINNIAKAIIQSDTD